MFSSRSDDAERYHAEHPPSLAPTPPLLTNGSDWREEARATIRDRATLERYLELTYEEREGIDRAASEGLPLAITPHYLSLIDRDDPSCPIRRQCVPRIEEARVAPGDLRDPLGEEAHEVAPGLIQRYPDRALLLVTDRCGVYCRFCTRSRMVGDGGGARSLKALEPAMRWLEAHHAIREVIVSGGDPLLMSTSRITAILERLASIEHLNNLRVATRTPVTLPLRFDAELCQALRDAHPSIWLMTHFNHPKEICEASRAACSRLLDAGIPVLNQTVLLRGVNDEASVLERLFRGLVAIRVRPYYLLQADPVRGTSHLRTPLSKGLALMEALQGRVSGIALPKLIVDTPGGRGKVPLSPEAIVRRSEGRTTLRTFRGEEVDYIDPPETTESDRAFRGYSDDVRGV